MKKSFALVVVLVMTSSMFTAVSAASSVFVAPDGLDSNDGSMSAPFATLQKAADSVSEGGIIYLRKGTYTSGAVLKNSVTIKAYNNEKVVFSAAQKGTPVPVTKEEKTLFAESDGKKNAVYLKGIERIGEVRTDGVSHALLCDGKYEYPASFMNDNVYNMSFEKKEELDDGKAVYSAKAGSSLDELKNVTDAYIGGSLGTSEFLSAFEINDFTEQLTITAYKPEKHYDTVLEKTWFVYSTQFISKIGEWAASDDKVYYYPRSTAKEIEYLADYTTYISAEKLNYIKISGIEFSKTLGNAINLKNCKNSLITDCTFKNITDSAIYLEECEGTKVFNCDFTDNAAECIIINGDRCTVDNCGFENNAVLHTSYCQSIEIVGNSNIVSRSEFSYSTTGAVKIQGDKNTVSGCNISYPSEFSGSGGIQIQKTSSDNIISQNYIHHSERNIKITSSPVTYSYTRTTLSGKKLDDDSYKEDERRGISVSPAPGISVSNESHGTEISKNIFTDIDYAVDIDASDGNKVTGNVFSTNFTYVTIGDYKDPDTQEISTPENNTISGNILCEQDDINPVTLKENGNTIENNVRAARSIVLDRDGSLKYDAAKSKIPEFEDINFDEIGRYEPETTPSVADTGIMLLIGSDNVSAKGVISKIEASARIVDGRTLVPVRYISEAFGETVGWDEATKTVSVGSNITITIGKPSITINGEEKAFHNN